MMWRQAGEQGFLGLEVPEEFGGSQADDYRFNMVFAEELAKVSMGLNSSADPLSTSARPLPR